MAGSKATQGPVTAYLEALVALTELWEAVPARLRPALVPPPTAPIRSVEAGAMRSSRRRLGRWR